MDAKKWAIYFVALLSFDYATASFFGRYEGVPAAYDKDNSGYYGWGSTCSCHHDLTSNLDGALRNVQSHCRRHDGDFRMKDFAFEEYELRSGRVEGFHKFERKGPYKCSLSRDYVRIYFRVKFHRVIVNYHVSYIEDLLHGILGNISSHVGRILGTVTNLLCQIALPDVFATVVIIQRFDVDEGFELEGLYLNPIEVVEFHNKRFSKHKDSFSPYFRPFCDHGLRNVFKDEMGEIFTKHFKKVTAEREMFVHESSEETDTYYSYEY